jgi:hypothetical protein
MVEKILARASGRRSVQPGDVVVAEVDLMIMHDLSGYLTSRVFDKQVGGEVRHPERVAMVFDHHYSPPTEDAAVMLEANRAWARRTGIHLFDCGNGNIHHTVVQRGLVRPGAIVVGSDSHTPVHGTLGALAVALGLLTPMASPVAALFLALAGVAHALARRGEREARWSALVAAAALTPPIVLSVAFPEGGEQPFPWPAYKRVALFVIACLVALPRGERTLRIGAALYGVGATVAFLLPTPVGSNATRLGILFGGPLFLCAVAGRVRSPVRVAALTVILAALAWWQLAPSVRHALRVGGPDPAGAAAYYRPVVAFLERAPGPAGRVEIPFTATHREAAEVGAELPLARGWERQLDVGRNRVFYDGALDAVRYERWLRENGVRWVALPDAAPDYSSRAEVELIRGGLPFLRERWRDRHWRVFEVTPTPQMVVQERGAPITLVRLGPDRATMHASGAGSATLRVRWTPYWHLRGGCVEPAGSWTRVTSARSGELALETRFSPVRLVERGRRCD